jgi:hypothetical protein
MASPLLARVHEVPGGAPMSAARTATVAVGDLGHLRELSVEQ